MKTKHTFGFTFFLGLVWTGFLFAYAAGPDPGVNGVVPGITCNQSGCHDSFPLNSGGGTVSIGGLPANWTPSQTYALTVTVSKTGTARYGFQFSAVNNSSNSQAGSLVAASPNDARVQLLSGPNGVRYAEHNSFPNTSGTFNFRWTAPSSASAGAVRFNVAGNATNNDNSPMNDFIYTTLAIVSPAAADTTPPVISAVTSSAITSSAATITWTTDEASNTQVDFGTTTAYGQTVTDAAPVTSHSVNLTGLSPSTTYHFRVRSADADANVATGGDLTFTTLAPGDTTAPVISGLSSSSITTSTALITWTTDEASNTQVEFGPTTSYGQSTTLDGTLATAHSVTLTGLASNTTYHYRVKSRDAAQNLATGADGSFITAFAISNLGGVSRITDGTGPLVTGYGRILATPSTPSGVAIFGFRQSGILVTEAGVPDSPLITAGRTYAEVSSNGLVNTGLAIANPNATAATIAFTIRDTAGATIKSGSTIIGANQQLARFLDQDPYFSGVGIQGTFSFTSDVPVSVVALRGFYNERSPSEFLITTLPVLDLTSSGSSGTQVIPHFAAGDGWTTQILLVNPTSTDQTGSLQFLDQGAGTTAGAPKTVNIDGVSGSSKAYLVKANSSQKFVITGAVPGTATGSVRVVPAAAGPAPTPLVIFSYKPAGITVSEAGVPVTLGTTFRMFAQLSSTPQILTGIAIANATATAGTVTLSLTSLDGQTTLGTSAPQALPPSGQIAGFLDQLIPAVAGQTVQGILRITTDVSSISVVGLRARYNERQPTADFLITTTPPTLETGAPSTAQRLFPHLANGGGYTTQFLLFSGTAGQASGGTLRFIGFDGTPLDLNIN